jgi:hypothetical protein
LEDLLFKVVVKIQVDQDLKRNIGESLVTSMSKTFMKLKSFDLAWLIKQTSKIQASPRVDFSTIVREKPQEFFQTFEQSVCFESLKGA